MQAKFISKIHGVYSIAGVDTNPVQCNREHAGTGFSVRMWAQGIPVFIKFRDQVCGSART